MFKRYAYAVLTSSSLSVLPGPLPGSSLVSKLVGIVELCDVIMDL